MTSLPKFIAEIPKVSRSKSENQKKLILCPQKSSSKRSPRQVQGQFDSPAKIFFPKVRKWWNEVLFFHRTIIESFFCRRKLYFWQIWWKISTESPKNIWSKSGNRKKNNYKFLKKRFLHKMFLWTRSSLTILPKNFRQKQVKFFPDSATVIKRQLDFSKQSSKHSSGDHKRSFDKHAGNFYRQYERFLIKIREAVKSYVFFFLKRSSSKFSSGHVNFNFQIPADVSPAKRPKIFSSINENDSIKVTFQKTFFNTFLWTPRKQFWRTCWQFFAKILNFFH